MSKIILEAEGKLEDTEAREWVEKIWTRLDTINDRTKAHTRDIQELRRMIKKVSSD